MNKRLRPRDETPLLASPHSIDLSPASKLTALTQAEPSVRLQLRQLIKITEFQLGDDIPIADFHWVCQGRVRLLCQPPDRSQETTVLLLETDGIFGADSWLFNSGSPAENAVLPYRAVAASSVQVAQIPIQQVATLLAQLPQLREEWQQQIHQRDRLIFLKTLTSLRSLSSQQLKQLEPHWVERSIAAGTLLSEAIPPSAGRFWLRQGQIRLQPASASTSDQLSASVPLPQMGDSWGYPHPVAPDWMAQTDLRLYQLPIEAWETVQAQLSQGVEGSVGKQNGSAHLRSSAALPVSIQPVQPQPPLALTPTPITRLSHQPTAPPVVFPKPMRRWLLDAIDRYPWLAQQSSSDCGAACLGMISRYWGKTFPLHVLREHANVGRAGASLKSLSAAAEGLGFQTRPVRASLGRLADQPNPWIAHWQGNHYVVVYRIRGNQVLIADPAVGRRSISRAAFQQHWTGYALLLDPTDRLQQTEIRKTTLSRYLGALLPYRSLMGQIILISILIQVLGLVAPLFTQIILDQVVVQKSLNTLNVFVLGLLLFGVWGICMSAVRQYLLSYFSNRLDLTLISGFIRHTLILPLKFFESRRVGDIITRVQENQKIQRFLIGQVLLAWLSFITGLLYLGLMFYYNWRLTLLVLALIPPIFLLTLGATPLMRRVSREIFNETANQNSTLVEMITGMTTVKSAAAEREFRWRWENHLTHQMNALFKGQKLGIGLQSASGMIQSLGSTALLWYGATLVIQNQLTIGQFVAFNMMMGYVISPVVALANLWDELQEVLISVERLNDVFEAEPEESMGQSQIILPLIQGEVEFADVTFRYSEDEEQNTLQNLSFTVQTGQTIAIVGRSGSGKSTLVKLLQGLYYANRGRVLIDGHDLCHVSPQSLRSQLGVVPQECFLFSGSILENITLYRPEFSLDQVIEVAKLAEAHPFIQAMPLGYSTIVGERGSALSGGQRQRIAIARALLGDPRILILDEATSSLDAESERRFQHNLEQISRNRTTFIIAHRLSTVRHADQILVLDRGILVEQGTHAELMSRKELYYHLAEQQLDL
jgi:ATP-binding cassette, subfamily B, bacterial HlyB/CyaB